MSVKELTEKRHLMAYVYRPAVGRAQAERNAIRSLLERSFGGSAEALLLRLIQDEQITPAQLRQLKNRGRHRGDKAQKGGRR